MDSPSQKIFPATPLLLGQLPHLGVPDVALGTPDFQCNVNNFRYTRGDCDVILSTTFTAAMLDVFCVAPLSRRQLTYTLAHYRVRNHTSL